MSLSSEQRAFFLKWLARISSWLVMCITYLQQGRKLLPKCAVRYAKHYALQLKFGIA
jgi:hypothetical protein